MSAFRVVELRVGRPRPFGPQGQVSAIDKAPVPTPLHAGPEGLEGDEQGDRRHHGGPDKAVHAYAIQNYPLWIREHPECAAAFRPGGFGENLVVDGVVEADICLGDVWRLGGCDLEVSQARQPCWKLNLRFGLPGMARRVQESGRTGWYFRVATPGEIRAGDTARLLARPHPEWSLERVGRLLYRDTLDRDALAAFAALPRLPERWRRLAENRLASGRVEDWRLRIDTPR
jgi:MOSC domain-containing protein YiiM